jgi:hypothetical protein
MKENETLNIRQLTLLFYCGKLLTTEIKQVNAKSGLLAQHRKCSVSAPILNPGVPILRFQDCLQQAERP